MAELSQIDLLVEAEKRGILPPDKAELLAEARTRGLVESPSEPAMSESEFTKARQDVATQDPTFRKLAGAVVPTLAAGAALIPGPQQPYLATVVGQSILGATATAANQAMGFEKPDGAEIIKSAIAPAVAVGILKAGKAFTKGGTELIAPGVLKEAGVEVGAESIGSQPTSLARSFTTPLSRGLYAQVAQQGPVDTTKLLSASKQASKQLSNLANKPRGAVKVIDNLTEKFRNNPTLDYGDIVQEVQIIKQNADMALAGKNIPTGKALYEYRGKLLDALDEVSPIIKMANAQFRKEESAREVVAALRSSNAANKLRGLFEDNPLVAGTYKPEDFKVLEKVAMEITDIPSAGAVGLGRSLLMAATEPIAQALTTTPGRYLVRQLMKPTGKITETGAVAITQFMRAYTASAGQISDTPEFKAEYSNTMRSFDIPIEQKIASAAAKDSLERANEAVKQMVGRAIGRTK